jgi:HAD superfamily hydrolase (TIGR01509 family)
MRQKSETRPTGAAKAIKDILFDAGDILYHRDRATDPLASYLARHGLPPYERVPETAVMRRRAYAGEVTKEDHHRGLLQHYGITDPLDVTEGIEAINQGQAAVIFFDGVAETLHRLKAAGFALAIVTNTFDSTTDKLQWFSRIGIEGVWDGIANSCELKISKPDPRIYLAALKPTGVQPEEAAFVGHAAYELEAAKSLGMTTIAFNRDSPEVSADHVADHFSDLSDIAGSLA